MEAVKLEIMLSAETYDWLKDYADHLDMSVADLITDLLQHPLEISERLSDLVAENPGKTIPHKEIMKEYGLL